MDIEVGTIEEQGQRVGGGGSMSANTRKRRHEHRLTIEAPPETVWKAITEADQLSRWFPMGADVEPGVGGKMTLRWDSFEGTNRIDAWEPNRHLRTTWMEHGGEPGRGTVVDWYLEGEEGRTLLRLVHSGFGTGADWDQEYDGTNRGWEFELSSLKQYLERHAGRERKMIWLRKPVDLPADAVWKILTGDRILEQKSLGKVGDHFAVTLACGDRLEGTVVLDAPPREFGGTVEGLNHGLFRLGFENCGAGPEAFLWLSTWGVSAEEVEAIGERWGEMLESALR